MKKDKIVKYSLMHALGVLVYIFLISLLMINGDKLFGEVEGFVGMMGFLLLFVFSATVVGGLVLGKPLMLYLDKDRKEATQMLFYTVGWLLILTVAVFVVMILV
jgi:hypothetical protein